MKDLTPAERLIVALDFTPKTSTSGAVKEAESKVTELARALRDTGVYVKVESALRNQGYGLIHLLHSYGVKVFADIKLSGIPTTLTRDGIILRLYMPDLLTVMCATGLKGLLALKKELPLTEVLGVTALTSMEDEDSVPVFGAGTTGTVMRLAHLAEQGGLDGFVSSAREVPVLQKQIHRPMTFVVANVRPEGMPVEEDDQNKERAMTIREAFDAGATQVVIGRPITQFPNPREATLRVIEEIKAVLESRVAA